MEVMTTEGCNKFRDNSCVRNCCNTRAEKAFKAGQQRGFGAGRKKVVKIVNEHSIQVKFWGRIYTVILTDEWQAKLKEWEQLDDK